MKKVTGIGGKGRSNGELTKEKVYENFVSWKRLLAMRNMNGQKSEAGNCAFATAKLVRVKPDALVFRKKPKGSEVLGIKALNTTKKLFSTTFGSCFQGKGHKILLFRDKRGLSREPKTRGIISKRC